MSIKVVCVTKVDGEVQQRVILEMGTSPANLITVADTFLALAREHGKVHGDQFERLECYLDEKLVQTRLLIEQVSTVFFKLRQRIYGDCGFTVFKHGADVKNFMAMVLANAQPTYLAPPQWTGHLRKSSQAKQTTTTGAATGDPVGDAAIIEAINKQAGLPPAEPVAEAAPSTTDTPPVRRSRRMNAANLGMAAPAE